MYVCVEFIEINHIPYYQLDTNFISASVSIIPEQNRVNTYPEIGDPQIKFHPQLFFLYTHDYEKSTCIFTVYGHRSNTARFPISSIDIPLAALSVNGVVTAYLMTNPYDNFSAPYIKMRLCLISGPNFTRQLKQVNFRRQLLGLTKDKLVKPGDIVQETQYPSAIRFSPFNQMIPPNYLLSKTEILVDQQKELTLRLLKNLAQLKSTMSTIYRHYSDMEFVSVTQCPHNDGKRHRVSKKSVYMIKRSRKRKQRTSSKLKSLIISIPPSPFDDEIQMQPNEDVFELQKPFINHRSTKSMDLGIPPIQPPMVQSPPRPDESSIKSHQQTKEASEPKQHSPVTNFPSPFKNEEEMNKPKSDPIIIQESTEEVAEHKHVPPKSSNPFLAPSSNPFLVQPPAEEDLANPRQKNRTSEDEQEDNPFISSVLKPDSEGLACLAPQNHVHMKKKKNESSNSDANQFSPPDPISEPPAPKHDYNKQFRTMKARHPETDFNRSQKVPGLPQMSIDKKAAGEYGPMIRGFPGKKNEENSPKPLRVIDNSPPKKPTEQPDIQKPIIRGIPSPKEINIHGEQQKPVIRGFPTASSQKKPQDNNPRDISKPIIRSMQKKTNDHGEPVHESPPKYKPIVSTKQYQMDQIEPPPIISPGDLNPNKNPMRQLPGLPVFNQPEPPKPKGSQFQQQNQNEEEILLTQMGSNYQQPYIPPAMPSGLSPFAINNNIKPKPPHNPPVVQLVNPAIVDNGVSPRRSTRQTPE